MFQAGICFHLDQPGCAAEPIIPNPGDAIPFYGLDIAHIEVPWGWGLLREIRELAGTDKGKAAFVAVVFPAYSTQ